MRWRPAWSTRASSRTGSKATEKLCLKKQNKQNYDFWLEEHQRISQMCSKLVYGEAVIGSEREDLRVEVWPLAKREKISIIN